MKKTPVLSHRYHQSELPGLLCSGLCSLRSKIRGLSDCDPGVFFSSGREQFRCQCGPGKDPAYGFGVLAVRLSISGALMQAITRNPIADPSILGVNTGASLFCCVRNRVSSYNKGIQYICLAFAGAALTAILVYGLASIGHGGATPIKLALAGAAASTALQSLVNTIMLPSTQVMDQFRFWQTGSISGADWADIRLLLPCFVIGFS